MNETLSTLVKHTLLTIGHYPRRLEGVRFPGVAVLCYHGVRPDDSPDGKTAFANLHVRASELEAHCRLVQNTCQAIDLSQWRSSLRGGPVLPPRPVLFTFDEGYRSVFTVARPILERYRIPAVVFICTDPVERRSLLWHDATARRRGEAEVERLKRLPFDEWRALADSAADFISDTDPNATLTAEEIVVLAAKPGFEIGSHTAAHAILAQAPLGHQRDQVARSKLLLEQWTGRPVTAFAYPNGQPGLDYDKETVDIVRSCGFDFAFTTRSGFAKPEEQPLERSRFLMLAGITAAELAHRLSYSWRR
jgi:peptidoglycan/xylan/chitin deacetylase (PgdA/CDA1 family)